MLFPYLNMLVFSLVDVAVKRCQEKKKKFAVLFFPFRTIESVKDIHRDIVSANNLTSYLVQPINIYHIVKRLSRDWQNVIHTLEQSKSCSKGNTSFRYVIICCTPNGQALVHSNVLWPSYDESSWLVYFTLKPVSRYKPLLNNVGNLPCSRK